MWREIEFHSNLNSGPASLRSNLNLQIYQIQINSQGNERKAMHCNQTTLDISSWVLIAVVVNDSHQRLVAGASHCWQVLREVNGGSQRMAPVEIADIETCHTA